MMGEYLFVFSTAEELLDFLGHDELRDFKAGYGVLTACSEDVRNCLAKKARRVSGVVLFCVKEGTVTPLDVAGEAKRQNYKFEFVIHMKNSPKDSAAFFKALVHVKFEENDIPAFSDSVLFVSESDWSNVGYHFASALRSLGVNAESVAIYKSSIGAQDSRLCTLHDIKKMASSYDHIFIMHSGGDRARLAGELLKGGFLKTKKSVNVFHGGSRYRRNHRELDKYFNSFVNASFIQTQDLMKFDAKNKKWLMPTIDLDQYICLLDFDELRSRLVVSHYPSNPLKKGTESIRRALRYYKDVYEVRIDEKPVSHEDNKERMRSSDIYIESQAYTIGDLKVGEWGVTALESAALGNIVVTCFTERGLYLREYGECPIVVSNSEEELEGTMDRLQELGEYEILQAKLTSRTWVREMHSYGAIGHRLMSFLKEVEK